MIFPQNIVLPFLYNEEGGLSLDGYVPRGSSTSGVTIAAGVDLGQIKPWRGGPVPDEMSALPLALQIRLRPYRWKRGDDAIKALEAAPLSVSKEEAALLMQMKATPFASSIKARFDKASSVPFESIPDGPATAIFDVTWQYGNPWEDKLCGDFWSIACSKDWSALASYLATDPYSDEYRSAKKKPPYFPDRRYKSRRAREARFCVSAQNIHNGKLIAES